jgi:hypothetical protein
MGEDFYREHVPIPAAAGFVTHDLLAMWDTQTRLELDAAHMAAAGVEFLPGAAARATLAAAHSVALCGLSPSVVHADAASDRMSFNELAKKALSPLRRRGGKQPDFWPARLAAVGRGSFSPVGCDQNISLASWHFT